MMPLLGKAQRIDSGSRFKGGVLEGKSNGSVLEVGHVSYIYILFKNGSTRAKGNVMEIQDSSAVFFFF